MGIARLTAAIILTTPIASGSVSQNERQRTIEKDFLPAICCNFKQCSNKAWLLIFAALLTALLYPIAAVACDNTLILLLTGDTAEESVCRKLVHISGEMQKTADLAQSFNHAATAELHQEVLNKWLYVASEITSSPPASAAEHPQFMSLLTQISRELGQVRRLIGDKKLETVHHFLEVSVARMSLLSAILADAQPHINNFIEFEIALFATRPAPGPNQRLSNSEFSAQLNGLNLPEDAETQSAATSLLQAFMAFDTAQESQNFLQAQIKYQEVYNRYVKLKRSLLDKGFFLP